MVDLGTSERYTLNTHGYGAHQAIIELVRKHSRVLDVGCNTGYLMSVLRDTCGCHCVGIEADMAAAARAEVAGFPVIVGDVKDVLPSAVRYGRFDHIIFADVLEHTVDPLSVLSDSRDLLSGGGSVLVSLPNIVSLHARCRLLLGVWRYADTGIFDKSHLRFFDLTTAKGLLTDAKYVIDTTVFVGPLTFRFGRRLRSVVGLRPGLLANQFIFCAYPEGAGSR